MEPKYKKVHSSVRSEVEIPLIHKGKSNGVLEVAFDKYKEVDFELLETLIPVSFALAGILEINESKTEIKQSYRYMVQQLQSVTEIYHLESAEHMDRIGNISRFLSVKMGFDSDFQEDVSVFSRLHDIGKLKVPIEILAKPSSLTETEMNIVKKHPVWGAEIIGKAKWLETARNICLHHHEKWNGAGYPCGLSGNNISMEGQIVSIADVYDALRSPRTYKKGMSHKEAMDIIEFGDERVSPQHFNPLLLKIFIENNKEIEKIFNETN